MTQDEWDALTHDEQLAAIEKMPCDMKYEPPFDFAFCERHDTTFALGSTCPYNKPAEDVPC